MPAADAQGSIYITDQSTCLKQAWQPNAEALPKPAALQKTTACDSCRIHTDIETLDNFIYTALRGGQQG